MSHHLSKAARPNLYVATAHSLLSLLSACSALGADHLRLLHAQILKTHFHKHVFLLTRLAHAYLCHCRLIPAKHILTKALAFPPLFLWNETIKSFSRHGFFGEAIGLYDAMLERGETGANEFTFTFILPACAGARSLTHGRRVHGEIQKRGCDKNLFVATALVDMYGKCGELSLARKMFDEMPYRKTAGFNAMIAGYVMNGECDEAMSIFNMMQRDGVKPDQMTMVSVLQACSSVGALQQGRWVHEQMLRIGMEINVYLGAALIHMYARCGNIDDSCKIFNQMQKKDLICWTSIISACGMHGLGETVEMLFMRMMESGVRPDYVTFVGLLAGFSHAGMVDKGLMYFKKMKEEFSFKPGLEHYGCIVDMLGRAGKLEEAENLVRTMGFPPDAGIWGGLLNASVIHNNVAMCKRVCKEILKLDPTNSGWYVLMSNVYATAGMWDEMAKIRTMMKNSKVIKPPGWSSIEIGGLVHSFLASDESHPKFKEIYEVLKKLEDTMRFEGYVAKMRCDLGYLEEEIR